MDEIHCGNIGLIHVRVVLLLIVWEEVEHIWSVRSL